MALSNIRNEPRRELTESAVGIGFTAGWLGTLVSIFYGLGWLASFIMGTDTGFGTKLVEGLIITIVAAMGVGAAWVVLMVTHAIGEIVCDVLENHDIYLRPRTRPERRSD